MASTSLGVHSSSIGLSSHLRSDSKAFHLWGYQLSATKQSALVTKRQHDNMRSEVVRIPSRLPVSTKVVRKSAAVVGTACAAFLSPSTINMIVMVLTIYYLAIFGAMITMGGSLSVRSFIRPLWAFLPLAVGYGVLLCNSWTSDTLSTMMPGSLEEGLKGGLLKPQFIPQLEGIMQLFQKPATAASLIVHLLAINLYLGRNIFLEGQNYNFPTWHSLLLACFTGPLGLLSHYATRAFWKGGNRGGTLVKLQSNGGTIMLMPYEEVWDYGKI